MRRVAIIIFPDPGFHRIALESNIGPYRPKTHHSIWTVWVVNVYVLLWAVYNFLGTGVKVSYPSA